MDPVDQELRDYRVSEHRYQRVLVAVDVDDFDSSDRAFDYGCTWARDTNSELGVVSVIETGDLNVFESLTPKSLDKVRVNVSHDLLTYAEKAHDFGVKHVRPIIAESHPGQTIVEDVIPDFKPDLVIVGSETKRRSNKNIGSQAKYIVEHSPVSVLVVRANN